MPRTRTQNTRLNTYQRYHTLHNRIHLLPANMITQAMEAINAASDAYQATPRDLDTTNAHLDTIQDLLHASGHGGPRSRRSKFLTNLHRITTETAQVSL